MKRFIWLILGMSLALPAQAQWAMYPAATRDQALEKAVEERQKALSMPASKGQQTIAVTNDSFEKVAAFYAPRGKEYLVPLMPGQPSNGYERELPTEIRRVNRTTVEFVGSGIKAKQVIILLDGAADLSESKDYISISRPFIFDAKREAGKMVYQDIRDITVIYRSQE
jgi:hypothetical protein